MAETIQTKQCSKCKRIKPTTDFYKESAAKDGHNSWCKECRSGYENTPERRKYQAKYRKTDQRKVSLRKYDKSEKGRKVKIEGAKRYRQKYPQKYIECVRRYQKTKEGKFAKKRAAKNYELNNPQKVKTRRKVTKATLRGKLQIASHYHCRICWNQAEQYHHHRGYEPEHAFDIIPVCKLCHRIIHKSTA